MREGTGKEDREPRDREEERRGVPSSSAGCVVVVVVFGEGGSR